MESLVTTQWLADDMEACDLRIVDASSHLPDAGRNAKDEYETGHIPGAVFMDLADLADPGARIENTLPGPERFASRMQSLGLGDGSRIVLYDDSAIHSAARAWFMLKLFGAQNVAILDGGLAKWHAEARKVEEGDKKLRHRHYTAWQASEKLRDKLSVLANIGTRAEQVVDARGAARFAGSAPEPRPGMAAGHIPGAFNVPYTLMYRPDGTFKDAKGIREAFVSAGVDLSRPIIASCGSGITACVLIFALHLIGKEDVALYDGSWAEWGADPAMPKETGPAQYNAASLKTGA
ncbi:3-mercaptopyruvate sulfurtransferase [Novosphingobium sp. SG707]|uniref:3-mercaptopyruvate sulfurtransferase n=1 Tax=Novosphingobium sp. SG707 TaxID=2586996 RepID=UPI001447EB9C|nr:3-mercaptopyruvate sulfurtransferase [Novosphingobium sp. SG707]NKI99101.1 thiosulfate/3-mercaptopyruvate sulfurtransferase [Novosphingobium sp. SG707]